MAVGWVKHFLGALACISISVELYFCYTCVACIFVVYDDLAAHGSNTSSQICISAQVVDKCRGRSNICRVHFTFSTQATQCTGTTNSPHIHMHMVHERSELVVSTEFGS